MPDPTHIGGAASGPPPPTPPNPKRALVERLLGEGMVMVTLDARRPGVDVPPRFAEEAQLRLNLSYRFGRPIDVNEWGVRASLTFGGVPYDCKLPWNALYGVVSHVTSEFVLFPDDVPGDLLASAIEELEGDVAPPPSAEGAGRGGKKGPRRLGAVPPPADSPSADPGATTAPSAAGAPIEGAAGAAGAASADAPPTTAEQRAKRPRPKLAIISPEPEPPSGPGARRGHLRIIK